MSEPEERKPPAEQGDGTPGRKLMGRYVGMVVALAVASVGYRILVLGHLEQSSLMFIGLPVILALLLASMPASKTATGMIMKGISMFLAMLGILLIEGFICILMAAPLFYSIGFFIGIFVDRARVKRDERRFKLVLLPALILMSLEGITGKLSFPRSETIVVEYSTDLSSEKVWNRLADGPQFDLKELPGFLRLGFPAPREIEGTGLEEGDTWRIHFAGGEGKPGDLTARVVERNSGFARLIKEEDTSHIAHWLDWKEASWQVTPKREGSMVVLTMKYDRLLDPAWYFKPIQRYGVRKAGEYFLDQTFK